MSYLSFPHHCSLQTANQGDRWALQKLVWQLIWAETLDFDLRVIGYRLGKLGLLSLLIGVEQADAMISLPGVAKCGTGAAPADDAMGDRGLLNFAALYCSDSA